jgi:coiled-coil domain-containing protein 61
VNSLPNVSPRCDHVSLFTHSFFVLDIEEITHKAGNFKKFSVFAKMLSSAFSKTNESVHIDILTLSDLELLKAQKTAKNGSASTSTSSMNSSIKNLNASIAHHLKRYAILTYTGEFDRVHYPLPLAFEEQPNVPALQRNLKRLRARVREQEQVAAGPSSEKEK